MQKNKKFLLPIITAISILFSGYIPVMADVDLSTIPAYTGEPYVEINDNVPDFPEDDFTTDSFESYSDLDNLGRCGVAYANIGQDLMPTEKRGSIGQVKPSGWHTQKYDNVDGKFAYNRCHLIGYQLTAENANEKNLITGTRYLNVEGMLPFENMVADYIKETDYHVLYRVTLLFIKKLRLFFENISVILDFISEPSFAAVIINKYPYHFCSSLEKYFITFSSQASSCTSFISRKKIYIKGL